MRPVLILWRGHPSPDHMGRGDLLRAIARASLSTVGHEPASVALDCVIAALWHRLMKDRTLQRISELCFPEVEPYRAQNL